MSNNSEIKIEGGPQTPEILKELYDQGKVDQVYLTPEEAYIMTQSLDRYNESKINSSNMAIIKHLAGQYKKDLDRPMPLFKRSEKLSIIDRFHALKRELNKIMFYKLQTQVGNVKYMSTSSSKVPYYDLAPAPFKEQIKHRIKSINRTRIGKLRWYEKIYSYVYIVYNTWRDKNE